MYKLIHSSCSLSLVAAASVLLITPCAAQKGEFNPHEGVRNAGMATPTPIDKLIALNMMLKDKVNWKQVAKLYKSYFEVDSYSDKEIVLPILMGMRMSDGVIAIQARDVEVLNAAAGDIETMAAKLGVEAGQLQRAQRVKSYANKNKWNRVFLELGFLQKDVMDTMAKEGNADRRSILIASGWIQGANIVSGVIKNNYSEETSSLLREPLLVRQMIKELENLKGEKSKDVKIVRMLSVLNKLVKIIDVPLNKGVPEAGVKEIHEITSQFSKFVLTNKS